MNSEIEIDVEAEYGTRNGDRRPGAIERIDALVDRGSLGEDDDADGHGHDDEDTSNDQTGRHLEQNEGDQQRYEGSRCQEALHGVGIDGRKHPITVVGPCRNRRRDT